MSRKEAFQWGKEQADKLIGEKVMIGEHLVGHVAEAQQLTDILGDPTSTFEVSVTAVATLELTIDGMPDPGPMPPRVLEIARELENKYHKRLAMLDEWYFPKDELHLFIRQAWAQYESEVTA
jgi:hypothetical protein